jgi:anti-sigma-K factor RskA
MNYRDPELQTRLAADYVVGLMRGGARRRFEQLMVADAALRREVFEWETRLLPLALSLPEVPPAPHVWRGIRKRIHALRPVSRWSWNGVALWRAVAGGMATALLAVLLVYPTQVQRAAEARYLAVLQDAQAQTTLIVSAARDGRLTIKAVADLRTTAGAKALELWALPAGGQPRSLGLVSAEGRTVLASDPAISDAPALAVSLEPPGGSPTGAPTGPVLYSGKVLGL